MSLPKKRLEFTVAALSEKWHWKESEIFKHARLGELPLKYGAKIPLPLEVATGFEASAFIEEVKIEQDGHWLKFQRKGVYLLAEDKLAFERRMREGPVDLPPDGTTNTNLHSTKY